MKDYSKIFLRKAEFSDTEFLWYLRNQPDVYKYARQNRPVSWDEHINWVAPVILGLAAKKLFVIIKQSFPIGQIRFDYISPNNNEISISVLKEFQGHGFAKKAFEKALGEIKKDKNIRALTAVIHKKNIGSVKFFEKLNFELKKKNKNWLEYALSLS